MAEIIEEIEIIYNISKVKKNPDPFETDAFDYLYGILGIIVVIVNFLVVLSTGFILKRRQEPRAAYIYLGNISLSDMIVGIVALFIEIYPYQFGNEILCSFSIGLMATATMSSVMSIGLIAIDRYLYILYGLHYHSYITTKHPPYMVLLIWFVGALVGLAPIFSLRRPMDEKTCWFIILIPPKFSLLLVFIGIFQMVLIIVLYSIILKNALESISRIHCASVSNLARERRAQINSYSANDNLPSSGTRSFPLPCCRSINYTVRPTFCENKWKAVKVVVFTAGAFFITWFPSFVTWIFFAFCDSENADYCIKFAYILNYPLQLLSLSNSLLNPIIYAWWHQGFRESVKKMYSTLLRKTFEKSSSTNSNPQSNIHQNFSSEPIAENQEN